MKTNATEAEQQAAFVEWFRLKYPKLTLYHTPNGELRNKSVARKLKKMGVLPGVFDLHLLDHHLFIEFKADNKGKLSEAQQKFGERAQQTGHSTLIVYGIDDAMTKVDNFIAAMETT